MIRGTTCAKPVIKSNGCLFTDTNAEIEWYDWLLDGKIISSNYYYYKVQEITPSQTGYYQLRLLFYDGCIKMSEPFLVSTRTSCGSGEGGGGGGINCDLAYVSISQRVFNGLELSAYTPGDATIYWMRDSTKLNTVSKQIIADEPGIYKATALFDNGCVKTNTFTISENYGCYVPIIQYSGTSLQSTFGNSFTWFLNDKKLDVSSQDIQVKAPGTYTVEVQYTTGCRAKSLPVIIYQVGSDCLEPTITIQDQLIISSFASSYEWFKDGIALGITEPQVKVNELGNYTVKVTYDNQCSKTSLPQEVELCTLSPKPYVAPQWDGNIAAIPYAAENKYTWYINGDLLPSVRDEIPVEHAGDYTTTIQYPNGCTKTSEPYRCHQANSGTDCLKPGIEVSGRSLKMIVSGPGFTSLNWVRNGEYLNKWEATLLADKPGYYSVEAYYGNGCTQKSDSVAIYFLGSECIEPTIRFDGNFFRSSSEQNNTWLMNGDTLDIKLPWIETTTLGEYVVVTTYPNGCTKASKPYVVTDCVSNITVNGSELTASAGKTFEWYLNGNPLGITSQTMVATETGNYTVRITCDTDTKLSSPVSLVVTGLELNPISTFSIYPNPTVDQFILSSSKKGDVLPIQLYSSIGQLLQVSLWDTHSDYAIDIQNEPPGIYLVCISDDKRRWFMRVVKK